MRISKNTMKPKFHVDTLICRGSLNVNRTFASPAGDRGSITGREGHKSLFLGGFTVKRSATGVSEYQGSSKIINKCSVSQWVWYAEEPSLAMSAEYRSSYCSYYRPPEGGRLYDMKVVSGYEFLRTYYV